MVVVRTISSYFFNFLLLKNEKVSNSLAAPVAGTAYDTTTPEMYDPRAYPDARVQYQETPAYTQAPPASSTPSTTTTSGPSRRERERDDRDSRHHGRRR
jgi:hypothetical protein